ncbi:MAG TPA: hypothetical protein VF470_08010 [Sphingomicrobium sp.]
MRLVFVHGINQEKRRAPELEAEWTAWLRSAMPDPVVLDRAKVEMPFYGRQLGQAFKKGGIDIAIQQGPGGPDQQELGFISAAMEEMAMSANIRGPAIIEEMNNASPQAIAQGTALGRRINAIVRIVERISPVHGKFVLPFVRQAYAYLRRPAVASAVDAIVTPHLEVKEPLVIVAHSLGTVVTFKHMRAMAQGGRKVQCPLYVTLGSPLALRAVSGQLGAPFVKPPGVERWVNAVEPADNVTLGKPLDASTFCAGIENIMDIASPKGQGAHDAQFYLKDPRIAATIEMALRAEQPSLRV